MTHELTNPFTPERKDMPTDEQVVGGVLGPEAVRAMRELRGSRGRGWTDVTSDLEITELELTGAEQLAAREAEGGPRQEMLDWANTFGRDEDWVDKKFTFHPGGRIESNNTKLDLSRCGITSISRVMSRVEGLQTLGFNNNQISKIENLPEGLVEIYLDDNNITKIENLPDELRRLDLERNHISTIENLPAGLQSLYLTGNSISVIHNLPSGLRVLDLADNHISVLENLPEGLSDVWVDRNPLTSIDGLPAPDKIGTIQFSQNQQALANKAWALGYLIHIDSLPV